MTESTELTAATKKRKRIKIWSRPQKEATKFESDYIHELEDHGLYSSTSTSKIRFSQGPKKRKLDCIYYFGALNS
jgi:hypothetical protein